MSNELITGIFTIIAGIITAIVHIFITIQAKKSAEKIAKETINNQKHLLKKSRHFDYLNNKKEFLENKVAEVYNIKESIKFEKSNDAIVNSLLFDFFQFSSLTKVIATSRHYLNEEHIEKIATFESSLNHYIKELMELIEKEKEEGKYDKDKPIPSRFTEMFNSVETMIDLSIKVLTKELTETTKILESEINAT